MPMVTIMGMDTDIPKKKRLRHGIDAFLIHLEAKKSLILYDHD
jgi:hypothetical protein